MVRALAVYGKGADFLNMKLHQKYAALAKVACATMQRVVGPGDPRFYAGRTEPEVITIDDVFDKKTQEQILGKRARELKRRLSRKRKKALKKKLAKASRMAFLELDEVKQKAYVKA